MIAVSSTADDAARRLWLRHHVGNATTAESIAVASVGAFAELQATLTRWVGAEGFRSLKHRALVLSRPKHPELAALTGNMGDANAIAAAVGIHGAAEVATGLVALVAVLIEVLGHIIGEDLAVRLVEQTGASSPKTSTEISKAAAIND